MWRHTKQSSRIRKARGSALDWPPLPVLRGVTFLFHGHLALDDVHHNLRRILVVNELGGNHVLKELVGHLPVPEIAVPTGKSCWVLSRISRAENDFPVSFLPIISHHRALARINLTPRLDHSDIKLPQ
jgi:hypothetical protein